MFQALDGTRVTNAREFILEQWRGPGITREDQWTTSLVDLTSVTELLLYFRQSSWRDAACHYE